MADVIVLGSGTSSGVPVLGVSYPTSFLANPKNHRSRPSILIKGPTGNLLVDCAPDMRTQLLREGIEMVDAVIVTHTHADHIMGMDDLRSFCLRSGADMPIYTLPQYAADVRRIFNYAFEDFPTGIEVPRFALHEISSLPSRVELCGLEIMIMLVQHGPWPVLALRIGDFAYVTDVKTIPPESWDLLQGLDTLILDAVRLKPHPNHYHFDEALAVAKELGAKQTYFNHLSHDYDHDVTNAELPPNIQLSFDGQRILI